MRVDTLFKYEFQYEYWVLTTSVNGTMSFEKESDGIGLVLPAAGGEVALITEEQLNMPMQVRNIRDRRGNPLTGSGLGAYPLYITTVEPQLSVFSDVIAWKHVLKREFPRKYSDILDDIVASAAGAF